MEQNYLVDQFIKGGPVMWPLLLSSLVGLGAIIERMWTLFQLPDEVVAEKELTTAEGLLQSQGEKGTVEHLQKNRGPLNFIFAALLKRFDTLVLEHRTDIEDMRQELILTTEEAGEAYLGRLLSTLATVAVVSPLLGLLGTITGMIKAFDAIARAGVGDPAAVAAGISEALITTATGLFIAIPAIVFHRWLSGRADKGYKRLELYCHAFSNTLLTRFQAGQRA